MCVSMLSIKLTSSVLSPSSVNVGEDSDWSTELREPPRHSAAGSWHPHRALRGGDGQRWCLHHISTVSEDTG